MIKTGECYFRDENGVLFLAESFENEETKEVHTTETMVEE